MKNKNLRIFNLFIFVAFSFIVLTSPLKVLGVDYVPLAPIDGLTTQQKADFVGPPNPDKSQSLPDYLNTLYIFAIGAAVALAIIMVIWGGIEYMMSGSGEGKSGGKERISSALLGLLLALGSYIILSTINRDLLNLDFNIKTLYVSGEKPVGADFNYVTTDPNYSGERGDYVDNSYLGSFSNDANGNVVFTNYGYAGDLTSDTNSSQRRGDNNNLLTTGSLALSPDLISQLKPAHGAAIYVNGTKVGYYDDKTAPSYNGKLLTGRIDIFDPSGSLGVNNFSKQTTGTVTVDNNDIRPQVSNP